MGECRGKGSGEWLQKNEARCQAPVKYRKGRGGVTDGGNTLELVEISKETA